MRKAFSLFALAFLLLNAPYSFAANNGRTQFPALRNGAATTDRLDLGSGVTTPDPYTVLIWVSPDVLTNGRAIWWMGTGAARKRMQVVTGGDVLWFVDRNAGVDAQATTSDKPLVLNQWVLLACVFDSANSVIDVYHGTPYTPMRKSTYSTNSLGSATPDSTTGMYLGNNNSFNSAFQGLIGPYAFLPRVLTIQEMEIWRQYPRQLPNMKVLVYPGHAQTGVAFDLTGNGNSGTATGMTVGMGPTIAYPWHRRNIFQAAAAGGEQSYTASFSISNATISSSRFSGIGTSSNSNTSNSVLH